MSAAKAHYTECERRLIMARRECKRHQERMNPRDPGDQIRLRELQQKVGIALADLSQAEKHAQRVEPLLP